MRHDLTAGFQHLWRRERTRGLEKAACLPDRSVVLWTLVPSAAMVSGAVVLFALGGYHAGFMTLNGLTVAIPAPVWSFLTALCDSAVALCLLLLFLPGNAHLAGIVTIASIVGVAYTQGFKNLWPLDRPAGFLEPDTFHAIGSLAMDHSFPSGHSQTAMTLVGVFMLTTDNAALRRLFLLLGLVMILSRVAVGMHWPIDVLAGGAGGLTCTLLGTAAVTRLSWLLSPVCVAIVTLLAIGAACMVLLGHPEDYPMAQPGPRVLAGIALAAFAIRMYRRLVAESRRVES